MSDIRAGWPRLLLLSERGQTTSEYLVLTGLLVLVAGLAFDVAGISLREALRRAALDVLSVVIGSN